MPKPEPPSQWSYYGSGNSALCPKCREKLLAPVARSTVAVRQAQRHDALGPGIAMMRCLGKRCSLTIAVRIISEAAS